MKWHTKMVIRKAFALLIAVLLTILAIILFISSIKEEHTSGIFLFVFLSLFMAIITYSTFKQLLETIDNENASKSIDFFSEFKNVTPYPSHNELLSAFYLQKNAPLYQDDKIIITNEFLAKQKEGKIFIIDGILDVVSFTQKANGIITYVSLIFLYYDGKRYEIKYRRPLGISNMQEKANNVNSAATIIATKSINFRKYPSYRLMER
ncbi:MAG: hypothetical protein IKJ93_05355 [Clostridia bacterium]|nr:hypothetical protein [Clostridia bacterium]